MSGVEIKKVKDIDDGMRLNRWFLKYYPGLSLGRFQKLLRTKQIKVDGKKAEASLKLAAGQEIRVPPLDNESKPVERQGVSAKDAAYIQSMVIYKDANIIALNKPSGLAVQGGTNTTRHVDGMLEALCFGEEEKPKLVHRIDKDTSGILVLARNRKTADLLTKAFREHNLQKTYLALVAGCPKQQNGEIKAALEKVGMKVTDSTRSQGNMAVTYKPLSDSDWQELGASDPGLASGDYKLQVGDLDNRSSLQFIDPKGHTLTQSQNDALVAVFQAAFSK